MRVGAVDMTTDSEAGKGYKISGYPTIMFFGVNKDKPLDYTSDGRTFDKFVQYCVTQVKEQVDSRLEKISSENEDL